ncbi:ATP-grasp domain-containing protein [Actinoplanes sp. TBRC 11911]|uniref:ATP-grasp domain-containing protein n=1 Tax=Actinoplanes sp. TBRC 11911 TaxID=2729386 RepID=UPI00145DC48F|nr:ATP-grasp domain-containing protein [Actinoplanes sp. TBRC 11911]NMO55695.1 ATP-grasp domain-containing protein [Actinoplanes sp. TBRC 11911]
MVLLTSDRSRYASALAGLGDALDVVDVDTTDVGRVVDVLRGYPDLAGLVRMMEFWSLPALAVARKLGLPHDSVDAVELVRDKGRLRRHLFENGFSRAPSILIDPHREYGEELAAALSYPVILKDVAGIFSENVWLVRHPDELPAVLTAARTANLRGPVLTAEPYFVGPLYSAETVSWDGGTRVLGVTSRKLSPEPHFREEMGSFPVYFPPERYAELTRWISAILESVGYREGMTHTEFIVTTTGFEIVEINARIGGATIGEAINRALGVNAYSAFVDLALGRRPSLMDEGREVLQGVGQVALYAPSTGVFDRIDGIEALAGHPGSPEYFAVATPGAAIESTIDQRGVLGLVMATGETAELAMHNAMSAAGKLTAKMRP